MSFGDGPHKLSGNALAIHESPSCSSGGRGTTCASCGNRPSRTQRPRSRPARSASTATPTRFRTPNLSCAELRCTFTVASEM